MKTIRKKITVCLMATVLIALVAVGSTSITSTYKSTLVTVEQMMSETAVLAAERIEQELTAYKNVAMDTGCIPQLSDASVPLEEKSAIIEQRVQMHGFQRGNIIGADGISIFDGKDYSDRGMSCRPCRGTSMYPNPWSARSQGICPSWWPHPSMPEGTTADG